MGFRWRYPGGSASTGVCRLEQRSADPRQWVANKHVDNSRAAHRRRKHGESRIFAAKLADHCRICALRVASKRVERCFDFPFRAGRPPVCPRSLHTADRFPNARKRRGPSDGPAAPIRPTRPSFRFRSPIRSQRRRVSPSFVPRNSADNGATGPTNETPQQSRRQQVDEDRVVRNTDHGQ